MSRPATDYHSSFTDSGGLSPIPSPPQTGLAYGRGWGVPTAFRHRGLRLSRRPKINRNPGEYLHVTEPTDRRLSHVAHRRHDGSVDYRGTAPLRHSPDRCRHAQTRRDAPRSVGGDRRAAVATHAARATGGVCTPLEVVGCWFVLSLMS